jgi:hypothetical protein
MSWSFSQKSYDFSAAKNVLATLLHISSIFLILSTEYTECRLSIQSSELDPPPPPPYPQESVGPPLGPGGRHTRLRWRRWSGGGTEFRHSGTLYFKYFNPSLRVWYQTRNKTRF